MLSCQFDLASLGYLALSCFIEAVSAKNSLVFCSDDALIRKRSRMAMSRVEEAALTGGFLLPKEGSE